jgi:hypothetical protein
VLRRAVTDRALLATAWALLLAAIVLVTATVALADAVTLGGLRAAIEAASPADRIVSVALTAAPEDAPAIAARVRPVLGATLGRSGGTVVGIARSGGLLVRMKDAPAGTGLATQLASFEDLEAHATIASGRWPLEGSQPIETVVSAGAASALRLRPGDRLVVSDSLDPSRSTELIVVGTFRPDAADPYWAGSALDTLGIEHLGDITTRGPLVVAASDLLLAAPRDVQLGWRVLPAVEAIGVDDVAGLRDRITSIGDRLGAVLPPRTRADISTGLPDILGDLDRSLLVTGAGVTLLALQFGILAGYAIILVAAVLVERRREQVMILRARGATGRHVAVMALAEAILLVVPAAVLAPIVAVAVVDAVGPAGVVAGAIAPAALGLRMLAATIVAAIGCIIALTLPTLASVVAPDGLRLGRAGTTTLAGRAGIDIVLLVLAGLALWQLGLYGAPLTRGVRGALGIDPLLVAAPAIGLVAGAVLAVRAVPRLAEALERLAARGSGSASSLGSRQLARRPLRYSRAALLLVLAVAFGTYALVDRATWLDSQGRQAAYRTVADVRVVGTAYDGSPTWSAGSTYRAIPGVRAAVPAIDGSFSVGDLRDGALLAVDPVTAARSAVGDGWTGATAKALAAIAAERPAVDALPLPDGARRLAVTIDAAMAVDLAGVDGDLPLDPAWQGISASVVVRDGDGTLQRLGGGDAAIGGGRETLEIPLATAGAGPSGLTRTLTGPAELEAVELTFSLPTGTTGVRGTVDIVGVTASMAMSGDAWTPVGGDLGGGGWGWRIRGSSASSSYAPPAGQPLRITFPLAPRFSGGAGDLTAGEPVTVRLMAIPGSAAPLAALVDPALLTGSGTRIGDTVTIEADAAPLTVHLAATTARLAPLDPNGPFIVVDGPSLQLGRYVDTGDVLRPSEWWLSVEPGAERSVLAAIRASASSGTTVTGREELIAGLRNDPVAVGVLGALALGALAAAVFAVVGFLVSATATTTERRREFAVLEALGLSGGELRTSLLLEDGFLVVVGLVGGVLLGLVLAWAVLPFATLTPTGDPPIPPPTIVVPWAALIPLALGGLLLVAVGVALAMRQLGRRPVGDLLREWEA